MEQFDDADGAGSVISDAASSTTAQLHPDEATTVNKVSAHPEATIPDSEYSLAEIEQRRARPVRWVVFALAVLLAIVIPYGYGRSLAINHTQGVLHYVSVLDPRGIALIAWTVTVLTFMGIGMSIIESSSWFWRVVFLVCVRKDSPWNTLTHSWSALSLFFIIELAAIAIVLFGGLITAA